MKQRLIIGVVGLLRSGKDTIADFLVEQEEFIHHSLSDLLRDETAKRGLPQTRDNWQAIGNEIREEYGIGELSLRLLEKIEVNNETKVVVSSLRNPGEIEAFRGATNQFHLVAIEAPTEMRYKRAKDVGNLADNVSFEEFQAQEAKEMAISGSGQQLGVCMSMADYKIVNDSSLNNLYKQMENILLNIEK